APAAGRRPAQLLRAPVAGGRQRAVPDAQHVHGFGPLRRWAAGPDRVRAAGRPVHLPRRGHGDPGPAAEGCQRRPVAGPTHGPRRRALEAAGGLPAVPRPDRGPVREEPAILLVTCCLEETRYKIARQVIDNIVDACPRSWAQELTVFDNASTYLGLGELCAA